jgi:hypothetical protein
VYNIHIFLVYLNYVLRQTKHKQSHEKVKKLSKIDTCNYRSINFSTNKQRASGLGQCRCLKPRLFLSHGLKISTRRNTPKKGTGNDAYVHVFYSGYGNRQMDKLLCGY